MTSPNFTQRKCRREAGVALLISIFILLIISGIALGMIMSTGTESALAGNYRSSTSAYYAGYAGLEEARGRLVPTNPNYFDTTVANFIPTTGPLALNQVRYILNPLPGETVSPTSPGTTYADTEYGTEFGIPVTATTVQTINSVWQGGIAGLQGPLYKWVRINAATEASLKIDVNQDGFLDATTPLYYDPDHLNATGNLQPSLIVTPVPPSTASQVFEVTSLAVLPNGSQKIMQYIVAPQTYGLSFPSPFTLPGSNVAFTGASSSQYAVNGTDGAGNGNNSSWAAVPGCTPNALNTNPAIGVTDVPGSNVNINAVDSGIPNNRTANYTGGGMPTPSVSNVTLSPTLSSPSSLNQIVQTISQNADTVINGNATQANLPPMSATNPQTVVVNGDFSMTGNYVGYGLLVVTGNFSYSGTTGWDGIILVIGEGTTTFIGSGGGNAGFNGALFVATTKDSSGNTLSSLGTVNVDINGGGGSGIYYDSCWINRAQSPPTFRVLSFRELPN